MKLYKEYIKERENADMYEDEDGFFTYVLNKDNMQINDVFVKKESRKKGIGKKYSDIIDNIAKENNYNEIYTTICFNDPNWQGSYLFQQKMGYEVYKNEGIMFFLKKEIKNG